jgi:hypothetical protein
MYRESSGNGCDELDESSQTEPCNEDPCKPCVIDGEEYEQGEVITNCTCEVW